MKIVTVSKKLEELLGGKWKWNRQTYQWDCDDGDRYVSKVLTGKDYNGEYTGETTMYMYSRSGSIPPKWVY